MPIDMVRRTITPSLIAHGGAGAIPRGAADRPERKRAILEAVRRGADILRHGGSALDAVVATIIALEDHPLFNAGTGSLLTTDATVEMDASVMVAGDATEPAALVPVRGGIGTGAERISAGAVAAVGRVRNPILLARAVMENTRHVLMAGQGAERLARRAGVPMCANEDLITDRARERWRASQQSVRLGISDAAPGHGTVGAVAIDAHGSIAAATSTGGVPGKIAGRIGDSAIIGAGTYADSSGAASATGYGEAIMLIGLCREAVRSLGSAAPMIVARRAITDLLGRAKAEGGIIMVDQRGRLGFAHNAAMPVGLYDADNGIRHLWPDSVMGTHKPAEKSSRRNKSSRK
ncbi:MAG: isoaspartyl peptidase/L-asparaginase family protein [Candidatus Binataceae bacterium]